MIGRALVSFALSLGLLVPDSSETAQADLPNGSLGDDYPWRWYADNYLHQLPIPDRYNVARQCSAFALWRVDDRSGRSVNYTLYRLVIAYNMRGAGDIDNAAQRAGYVVDATPSVGALAVWEAGDGGAGPTGHVAYVARLYPHNGIVVEEYNFSFDRAYDRRLIPSSSPDHFVHVASWSQETVSTGKWSDANE